MEQIIRLFPLIIMLPFLSCKEDDKLKQDIDANGISNDLEVYLAQTHVKKPSEDYFRLVSNKTTLLKVQVTSPAQVEAPEITAEIGSEIITLEGPANLPDQVDTAPGTALHQFKDSYSAMIPPALIKPGMSLTIFVGDKSYPIENIEVGAPNKLILNMVDLHFFSLSDGDYPEGWETELESKLPIAELELKRLRQTVFEELTVPPRGNGIIAARTNSKTQYTELTGANFDGEQLTAVQWKNALRDAAGKKGKTELFYVNIYGVASGGQAGGFSGVGNGRNIGIFVHELGHALSLPHWGDKADYPYRGDMHGIPQPDVYQGVHVGPVWAYSASQQYFIPPTVQDNAVGGTAGTYKKDPMQGGGQGDQEEGFIMRHFSDYSVFKMQQYLEQQIEVYNPDSDQYAGWDNNTGSYSKTFDNNGLNYPIERNVEVISVMAGLSSTTPQATIVYPPIGPYTSGITQLFDANLASDMAEAANKYCPENGCDVSVRVTQGGAVKTYILPIGMDETASADNIASFVTKAINLRASDGAVTAIDLLSTPDVELNGLPGNPNIIYSWSK